MTTSMATTYANIGTVVGCFCRATGFKSTPVDGALSLTRDTQRIIITVDWKGRVCVMCCPESRGHYKWLMDMLN